MKQKDEMLEEYDFSNGVRGKYAQAYKEGVNIIKFDTDVIKFITRRVAFSTHHKTKLA